MFELDLTSILLVLICPASGPITALRRTSRGADYGLSVESMPADFHSLVFYRARRPLDGARQRGRSSNLDSAANLGGAVRCQGLRCYNRRYLRNRRGNSKGCGGMSRAPLGPPVVEPVKGYPA